MSEPITAPDMWAQRWPDHCHACRGWGGSTFYQSHPYGMGSASERMFEPCDDCSMLGKCARCGELGLTNEDRGDESTGEGPCKFCGWNYEDGQPEPEEFDGEITGAAV